MPRNINLIPSGFLTRREDPKWVFIRMDWPSPVGTLRWTNEPGLSQLRDVGDGDSLQSWDGTKGTFVLGQIASGEQNAGAISDLTFSNTDKDPDHPHPFVEMLNQFDKGCEDVPIAVYYIFYQPNVDDSSRYDNIDRVCMFRGRMDKPEVGTKSVRVSLKPGRIPLSYKVPRVRYTLGHGFKYIPPENDTFTFGVTGQVTIPNPRIDTAPPSTGGGGGSTPGDVGGNDPGARGPIVRGPTRGRPPTATRGTRTVSR